MKTIEIVDFVKENIKYKDWEFFVVSEAEGRPPYLQIQFNAPDNITGVIERQYCRKWQLSNWMTKTEICETCWKAVRMAEEHEARENFLYKGFAIFNPHTDVEQLVFLHKSNGVRALDMRGHTNSINTTSTKEEIDLAFLKI